MLNLTAARLACREIGIADSDFDRAIATFNGASKRLECLWRNEQAALYKDFAHAPSKLRATIAAVREQYPDHKLIACMELHTFSSLTADFLPHYRGCMDLADIPFVYFNPHAIELKKLPPLSKEQVKEAFGNDKIEVFNDSKQLMEALTKAANDNRKHVTLMMSSGNFDGINMNELKN